MSNRTNRKLNQIGSWPGSWPIIMFICLTTAFTGCWVSNLMCISNKDAGVDFLEGRLSQKMISATLSHPRAASHELLDMESLTWLTSRVERSKRRSDWTGDRSDIAYASPKFTINFRFESHQSIEMSIWKLKSPSLIQLDYPTTATFRDPVAYIVDIGDDPPSAIRKLINAIE